MDSSVKGMICFGANGVARGRCTSNGAEPASRKGGTCCGGAIRTSAGGGGALGLGGGEGDGAGRLGALASGERSARPSSGSVSARRGSVTSARFPPLED